MYVMNKLDNTSLETCCLINDLLQISPLIDASRTIMLLPYYSENNPTPEIIRDFGEKSKNDSNKTAETPRISRKCSKKKLK